MSEFMLGFIVASTLALVIAATLKLIDNRRRRNAQIKWEDRGNEIKVRRRQKGN